MLVLARHTFVRRVAAYLFITPKLAKSRLSHVKLRQDNHRNKNKKKQRYHLFIFSFPLPSRDSPLTRQDKNPSHTVADGCFRRSPPTPHFSHFTSRIVKSRTHRRHSPTALMARCSVWRRPPFSADTIDDTIDAVFEDTSWAPSSTPSSRRRL